MKSKTKKQKSNPNMNDSIMSTGSLAIEEDDYINLIKDLDIEDIN